MAKTRSVDHKCPGKFMEFWAMIRTLFGAAFGAMKLCLLNRPPRSSLLMDGLANRDITEVGNDAENES